MNDVKTYIGIDLGGTFIKYGIVNEDGEIIEKGKAATPAGCGYAETVEVIVWLFACFLFFRLLKVYRRRRPMRHDCKHRLIN